MNLEQPLRLTVPEGYFVAGRWLGFCGCGCRTRLLHASGVVRRGDLLYLDVHDPEPDCQVCGVRLAETAVLCWGCSPLERAMQVIGDGLADCFAPRNAARLFRHTPEPRHVGGWVAEKRAMKAMR